MRIKIWCSCKYIIETTNTIALTCPRCGQAWVVCMDGHVLSVWMGGGALMDAADLGMAAVVLMTRTADVSAKIAKALDTGDWSLPRQAIDDLVSWAMNMRQLMTPEEESN